MNNTLKACGIAAAGLVVAHTANAQSTVTIYGQIDVGYGYINKGTSSLFMPPPIEAGKHGVKQLKNSGPSWLGFRGVEDLGGGLKAGFDLQTRIAVDTGSVDATGGLPFWQGRSLVYLRSDSWGEIFLGRDNYPAFYNGLPADPFLFDYSAAALGPDFTTARYTVPGEGGTRASNQLGWRSPRWSGFGVTLGGAAGEATGRGSDKSLLVNYVAGPVYAGFGHESARLATGGDRTMNNLTGSYDFGVAKLALNWARTTDDGGATPAARRVQAMSLGLTVPLGSGVAKLAIGKLNPDGANNDSLKIGIGYEYSLSKRTSLRASLGSSKTDGLTRSTGYDLGLLHRF